MKSDFKELLKPYRELVETGLAKSVHEKMPLLLHKPIRYFLELPGKRIRPILVMATAEAFGSKAVTALPAALAIEILHDFTLIHDDIMDEDQYRRGFPTVHNKWDIGTGLLAGDAMVAIAYQYIEKCETPYKLEIYRQFTDGMYIVCAGQALDKEFEQLSSVDLDQYITMISQKTGRLLSLSLELGYLFSGNDSEMLHTLKKIGNEIGLAFQIQDDLLDFTANQQKLGKDVGSDWRQNKKTYITIQYKEFAQEHSDYPADIFSVHSFDEAYHFIKKAGIFKNASDTVKQHLDNANKLIQQIGIQHPVLTALLDFLQKRTF